MKPNLSKLIKLDRIPERYYAPHNEIDRAALSREEKVYVEIYESVNEAASREAQRLADIINKSVEAKGKCVMALGAGNGTHPIYQHLIELNRKGKVSFRNVIVFNISEFYSDKEGEDMPSTLDRLHRVLLDHVDIIPANIHSMDVKVARNNVHDLSLIHI